MTITAIKKLLKAQIDLLEKNLAQNIKNEQLIINRLKGIVTMLEEHE